MTTSFSLDSQLEADSLPVAESELCLLRLLNDVRYPWLLLIPKRAGVSEIFELSEAEQVQLLRESSAVAAALHHEFSCDKINVAAIGNIVRQLHLHHVVRRIGDPAWPAPVWGHSPRVPYDDSGFAEIVRKLREGTLDRWFSFTQPPRKSH